MLNPLFDAIDNIDDNIIVNAQKTHKKPILLRAGIIAAAAATLLVGFTVANRNGVRVNNKDAFDYSLTVQEMTIPTDSEMNALGAVNQHKSEYTYEWKTLPSSLFKTFGISPVMNEFFSESECENFVRVNYTSDGVPANTTIDYELTDKNLNKEVKFQIFCMNKEGAGLNTSLIASAADKDKTETLTLKDESKAIIYEDFLGGYNIYVSSANFSYDGIAYSLTIRDGNSNDMKQVLADLGVL